MVIQLSGIGKAHPSDLRAILPALAEAAEAVELDHARLAAVLDWVQYRNGFRAPVMVRPFGRTPGMKVDDPDAPPAEIAIDVRRAKDLPYHELVREIVDRLSKALGLIPDVHECIHLEDWVRPYEEIPAPPAMRVAPSADLQLDELLRSCRSGRASMPRPRRSRASPRHSRCCTTKACSSRRTCSVRELSQFAAYRGPGKLEGSIVNWLNGPVFQPVGERSGFRVAVEPFAYREGSNTVVLHARPRDAFSRAAHVGAELAAA